jgi:hypothetical protein
LKSFPRLDILPAAQRQIWASLSELKNEGFVLYGGTAVALFLGHRESVDFDFFVQKNFLPDHLLKRFGFLLGAELLQSQPDTLTALALASDDNDRRIKISFFGGLDFGRLQDPVLTPDGNVMVASTDDLLAHKLKTLLQRVEQKDYLDIDALLTSGLDLGKGIGGARALFQAFSPQECLKALTYFNDPSLQSLPTPLRERLVSATRAVRAIPSVLLKATTLS